jgi:hypothetical protein
MSFSFEAKPIFFLHHPSGFTLQGCARASRNAFRYNPGYFSAPGIFLNIYKKTLVAFTSLKKNTTFKRRDLAGQGLYNNSDSYTTIHRA